MLRLEPPELGFRTVRAVSDYVGQVSRRDFELTGVVSGESGGAPRGGFQVMLDKCWIPTSCERRGIWCA